MTWMVPSVRSWPNTWACHMLVMWPGSRLPATRSLVRKEYAGGLIAEMEVKLPAVLGIQAAEQPPRYVAYSKIRQVMGTAKIEERAVASLDLSGGTTVSRMFQPEVAERATMIEGSADEVADKLVGIFKELGTL